MSGLMARARFIRYGKKRRLGAISKEDVVFSRPLLNLPLSGGEPHSSSPVPAKSAGRKKREGEGCLSAVLYLLAEGGVDKCLMEQYQNPNSFI
jgi:hypothetical protein